MKYDRASPAANPPPYTPSPSNRSVQEELEKLEPVSFEDPYPSYHEWAESAQDVTPPSTTSTSGERTDDISCTLLPERPAFWQFKNKNFKLSHVAARILLKESRLRAQDLQP